MLADAAEALKCQCARLKIPYDGEAISVAIRQVERTRSIVTAAGPTRPSVVPLETSGGVSRAAATQILRGIGVRL